MPKTVIVTGANGGMGSVAVKQLAAAGWNVIPTTRAGEKYRLDLCSKESIDAFVAQLQAEGVTVDALFNNAGVLAHVYEANDEGYESTLCTNLIGPARLINGLLNATPFTTFDRGSAPVTPPGGLRRCSSEAPGLFAPDAHIVNMVSLACYTGFIKDDYFCHRDKRFHQIWRYSDSKLGFMLYSLELQEHLAEIGYPGIRVDVADPGIVNTNMIRLGKWFDPLTDIIFRPICNSPLKGVTPALNALTDPELVEGPVRYFVGKNYKPVPSRYIDHPRRGWLWDELMKRI